MSRDASTGDATASAAEGPRDPRAAGGRPVRPRLPAGARDHAASELAAARGSGDVRGRGSRHGGVRGARRNAAARRGARLRLVDRGHDRAVGRGEDLLPPDLRRRRGSPLVGAHPHVRLAGGRGRDGDGRAARAEAGRRRRGARARRRLRLEAVRRGRGDVQRARGRRRADRRQRRPPGRPRRAVPGRPAAGLASGRGGPLRSPQALSSSTAPSPGPAARGSRTTSRTAASTT